MAMLQSKYTLPRCQFCFYFTGEGQGSVPLLKILAFQTLSDPIVKYLFTSTTGEKCNILSYYLNTWIKFNWSHSTDLFCFAQHPAIPQEFPDDPSLEITPSYSQYSSILGSSRSPLLCIASHFVHVRPHQALSHEYCMSTPHLVQHKNCSIKCQHIPSPHAWAGDVLHRAVQVTLAHWPNNVRFSWSPTKRGQPRQTETSITGGPFLPHRFHRSLNEDEFRTCVTFAGIKWRLP